MNKKQMIILSALIVLFILFISIYIFQIIKISPQTDKNIGITPPPSIIFKPIGDKIFFAENEADKKMYLKLEKGAKFEETEQKVVVNGKEKELKVYKPL